MRLFKKSRALHITDHLECNRRHEVEVFFHFSEECLVQPTGSNSFEASVGNKRLLMRIDSRLKPVLNRGSENPISGWRSRTFGVKEPSFSLVARSLLKGPAQFHTEISGV
jgi:hypothetical protein